MNFFKHHQKSKGIEIYRLPDSFNKQYSYHFQDTEIHLSQNVNSSENFKIYGWIIESNYRESWYHYNNKIYQNRDICVSALNNIQKLNNLEYRIKPLYSDNDNYYRNMVISRILSDAPGYKPVVEENKIDNIEFFKVRVDFKYSGQIIKKGRLVCCLPCKSPYSNIWVMANSTDPSFKIGESLFDDMLLKDILEENINIFSEKYIFPHISKEVKKFIKI